MQIAWRFKVDSYKMYSVLGGFVMVILISAVNIYVVSSMCGVLRGYGVGIENAWGNSFTIKEVDI